MMGAFFIHVKAVVSEYGTNVNIYMDNEKPDGKCRRAVFYFVLKFLADVHTEERNTIVLPTHNAF